MWGVFNRISSFSGVFVPVDAVGLCTNVELPPAFLASCPEPRQGKNQSTITLKQLLCKLLVCSTAFPKKQPAGCVEGPYGN